MGHGRTDEFRKDSVRIALTSGLTRKQVADLHARLPDIPISRVHELLAWHWMAATELKRIAA